MFVKEYLQVPSYLLLYSEGITLKIHVADINKINTILFFNREHSLRKILILIYHIGVKNLL